MVNTSYLSKMRTSRGRDESVDIIGDRENLIDMLQNPSLYNRKDFNGEIASCYSGASYGNSNWAKVLGAWGDRPEITTIHGVFAERHPGMEQLNLDQGLVTHLPEFMEFMESNNNNDYSTARDSFQKHLGTRTLWRGMVLNNDEAEKMRYEGIESDFLRKNKENTSMIENFEANVLSAYFDDLVERQFLGENYQSPLISVSSHKDVAMAVGRHFGRRRLQEKEADLYLFKLNVPEIDLVYCADHAVKLPCKLQDLVKNGTNIRVSVNDIESSYPWDKNTESYLMHKIDAKEIIEISKPDIVKSSWNGQVLQ